MSQRTRAPHSRVSGIRRPRVAGHGPAATRPEAHEIEPESGRVALDETPPPAELPASPVEAIEPVVLAEPAAEPAAPEAATPEVAEVRPGGDADAVETGPELAPRRRRRPLLRGRVSAVPLLAVALVVCTAAAVVFGIADARLRGTPSASNAALVDVAASTQATEQLTDALKTIYSYDYARLDENEKASRAVITPAFADQFGKLFAQVRELAPQQQAVVTATVPLAALRSLEGDHAVLVAFMDQQATRVASGGQPSQLAASGRLTVTGEKVDGQWKIADVQSR